MRFPCLSVAYQLTTTHPPVAGAAEALCPVGNAGASAAVLDVAAAVLDEAAVVPSELAKVWGNLAPGSKVAIVVGVSFKCGDCRIHWLGRGRGAGRASTGRRSIGRVLTIRRSVSTRRTVATGLDPGHCCRWTERNIIRMFAIFSSHLFVSLKRLISENTDRSYLTPPGITSS